MIHWNLQTLHFLTTRLLQTKNIRRMEAGTGKEESQMTSLLADISVRIGSNVWTLSSALIVEAVIAAVIGFIAEFLVGGRLQFGIIGAIIVGFIGVWLTTQVIIITGIGDITIDNVPLIRGIVGAAILIAVWHLITYPLWRSRTRFNR
jgi:uncharacterized membrane protein YeaQ/YmgE (transglycosylase-associated protein family)